MKERKPKTKGEMKSLLRYESNGRLIKNEKINPSTIGA